MASENSKVDASLHSPAGRSYFDDKNVQVNNTPAIPRPMKRKVSYSKWTYEEDQSLLVLVELHGTKDWTKHGEEMRGRTGKQCRERYVNHLIDGIKKGEWTKEEEDLIVKQQARLGNQWSVIAEMLPGRSDNAVKGRWHTVMSRGSTSPRRSYKTKSAPTKSSALAASMKLALLSPLAGMTTSSPFPSLPSPQMVQLVQVAQAEARAEEYKNKLVNTPSSILQMSCVNVVNTRSSLARSASIDDPIAALLGMRHVAVAKATEVASDLASGTSGTDSSMTSMSTSTSLSTDDVKIDEEATAGPADLMMDHDHDNHDNHDSSNHHYNPNLEVSMGMYGPVGNNMGNLHGESLSPLEDTIVTQGSSRGRNPKKILKKPNKKTRFTKSVRRVGRPRKHDVVVDGVVVVKADIIHGKNPNRGPGLNFCTEQQVITGLDDSIDVKEEISSRGRPIKKRGYKEIAGGNITNKDVVRSEKPERSPVMMKTEGVFIEKNTIGEMKNASIVGSCEGTTGAASADTHSFASSVVAMTGLSNQANEEYAQMNMP